MELPPITIPSDLDSVLGLQIKLVNCETMADATAVRAQMASRVGSLLTAFRQQEVAEWEGMSHGAMVDKIIQARWTLVENFGYNEKVNEYISEAEHQDGFTYWLQFPNFADVLYDFHLYLQALED